MTRRVVTRSPSREVGTINCGWLLSHPVDHESHLERRFVMVALACPVVKDIVHQPVTLELKGADGISSTYTPDFQIGFYDGSQIIVEVKPKALIPEHRQKLDLARAHLAKEATPFLIVTEKQIDVDGLSARAVLLMRYGRLNLDPKQALECKRLLDEELRGDAKVYELISKGISESLIWNMVAKHELRIPPGINVNPTESIAINHVEGGCHDYFCTWLGIA
jgi:hypothetical protein